MNKSLHLTMVVGARPNFAKIASLVHASPSFDVKFDIVHTGQHYDKELSSFFLEDLEIPMPRHNFGIGSGSHTQQTSAIMLRFEEHLSTTLTDWVVVVGDVNSTLACALVAAKMQIRVAHVEAGLESGDLRMPEEINRRATDSFAEALFCTSEVAVSNLIRRGRSPKDIHLVGNTMIDTLSRNLERTYPPDCIPQLPQKGEYAVCTLHRPSNVDDAKQATRILSAILDTASVPVIFPVHPRTRPQLDPRIVEDPRLIVVPPLRYLEFLHLTKNTAYVLTDSGGLQEETTYLGVPCLTLRSNTERPETVEIGTNEIIGTESKAIMNGIQRVESGRWKTGQRPPLWDGRTGERILNALQLRSSMRIT